MGGGSFTFVGNGGSGNGTLTNSTTLANLGLDGVSFGGSAGVRTLGGLTITGSNDKALTGKGVRFGGTVTINGVTSGSVVGGLRLIEGGGISVVSTSAFSGKLTLVGNGAGLASDFAIMINANLTTGTTDDGVSDLTLLETASATALYGIQINTATVTAGGNLSVINNNAYKITLSATSTAVGMGVSLVTGTNNWVKLQTRVLGVMLSTANNFTVTSGSLRLDFGKLGTLNSIGGTNFTLNAAGSDVYFTGNTGAHTATIAVGSGSFTFVNDKRDTTTETVLGNTAIASVAGLGSLVSGTATGGLTVTTTGVVATINRQGVVYGGTVTINGVTTGNAMNFTYIEGTKIEVPTTATASTFAGPLALVANGVNGIDLGIGLTAGGNISILAPKFTMSGNVTIQPTTSLLINLGGGEFVNGTGAGFTLGTNSKNLTFIAGNVFNTTATNAVFNLGSGSLTLKGGLGFAQGGGQAGNGNVYYDSNYITSAAEETAFTGATSYYFTSLTGDALAAAKVGTTGFWLNASALSAGNLGTKYTGDSGTTLSKYSASGFSGSTGSIWWKNAGAVSGTNVVASPAFTLAGSKAVHFYGVTTMWSGADLPTTLTLASSITFDGANQFKNGLLLNCDCAVTQSSGSTLEVTGGNLAINATRGLNLSQTGNQLNSLGIISVGSNSVSANLSIASDTALTLNGSLSGQGGTITIRVKDGNLKLAVNQTSTSGGKVTIDLGTGVYDASSTSVAAGFTWTTGGKSLDLTVGGIKAGTGNVFVLGAGTLTHNLRFESKSFGTNLYFSNDRSITANNIKDAYQRSHRGISQSG